MISINKTSTGPLYLQIYSQLRQDIASGVLAEGTVLIGSRMLAAMLGVSRNTVDNAYGQLMAEGYIAPRRGVGFEVLHVPSLVLAKPCAKNPSPACQPSSRQDQPVSAPSQAPKLLAEHIVYDLTNSSHTVDLFPKSLWKKYTLECLEMLEREEKISALQTMQGELYLRRHLLAYLKRIRGVRCTEEQIIITCGLQQSLEYICKIAARHGQTIVMEDPGYNKAAAVFRSNHISIQTVPVDENGLTVANLPAQTGAFALYATPSHQFPTGVTLPIGRRHALLAWAQRNGVYILEDDFDSELRYYSKPIPSLQSIDAENRVIYLGTFSKGISPSIRMGYMILPPQLAAVFAEMFAEYNSTVPVLNQYIIGRLLETGQYDRHIRRLGHVFKNRLALFIKELSCLGAGVRITGNGTGQYFLLRFPEGTDQQILIAQAMAHGVRVYPTMQFWQEKAECPPHTLFLGFGKIRIEDIPDCVARLKAAWAQWLE
ncbi:PLP-dependent aminotransferase family protein [Desulfovibrio sp.]|uniref:MocR-like pyridoxine biosynthesis transcription factor PdxR n=1 Tax=Desulfovibrio sp. TaxID=885 RepID=UPI0035AEDCB6